MAKLTLAVLVLLTFGSCAKEKKSDIEQLRSAIRNTLTTKSYTVTATSKSFGQTFSALTAEHIGTRGRVRAGSNVRGVFIGDTVYLADDKDPGSFMKCGPRQTKGSRRTFDPYAPWLRRAARVATVKRHGKTFVIDALDRTNNGRTEGGLTLEGSRVETLTLTTLPTGANVSPPATIVFRFNFDAVPEITAPPSDVVEEIVDC